MTMKEEQIIRCIRNEADAAERAEVGQWIAQSGENRALALKLYRIHRNMEHLHAIGRVDTEAAKRRIHERMAVAAPVRRCTLRPRFAFAATLAVLVVAIVAGIGYFSFDAVESVSMTELYADTGTTRTITLSDGTQVWLNANSTLRYPEQFANDNREVELDGEAYFKVTKSEGRKFTVMTADMQIEVLGTEFDVDSYNISGRTSTVTLVSGKVRMSYTDEDKLHSSIILKPNQRAELDASKKLRLFNTSSATSAGLWKDNKIVFNHTSFASAVRIIENRYNVSVRVNNPRLYDYTFSGTFIDADLDTVLRFLSLASGIEFDCSALDSASDAKQRRIIEAN